MSRYTQHCEQLRKGKTSYLRPTSRNTSGSYSCSISSNVASILTRRPENRWWSSTITSSVPALIFCKDRRNRAWSRTGRSLRVCAPCEFSLSSIRATAIAVLSLARPYPSRLPLGIPPLSEDGVENDPMILLRCISSCSFNPDGSRSFVVMGLQADCAHEAIREAAYKLYLHPDGHQLKLLDSLLDSRQELARLCGFKTHAHRVLKGSIGEPITSGSRF